LHPTLHLGGLELRTWALVVTAGVLLSWALLLTRTSRLGYPRVKVFLWVLLAFPVGALGGMLLDLAVRRLTGGAGGLRDGLSVLGSIGACVLFSMVYVPAVFREPPWRLLDAVAFTMPLSAGIGRLGCLLNGCCFGQACTVTTPILTVPSSLFDPSSPAGAVHQGGERLWNVPLLLAIGAGLAIVAAEVVYRRRARWRLAPGAVLATAILVDSAWRFWVEFLRDERLVVGPLNPWHLLTLAAVLVAATVILKCRSISSTP
jgi:prolipoprotein diacylglyceryltransferase